MQPIWVPLFRRDRVTLGAYAGGVTGLDDVVPFPEGFNGWRVEGGGWRMRKKRQIMYVVDVMLI